MPSIETNHPICEPPDWGLPSARLYAFERDPQMAGSTPFRKDNL
jgi:hypothetical protein